MNTPRIRQDIFILLIALGILVVILVLSGCGAPTDAAPTTPASVTATVTTSVPTTIGSRVPEAWDTTTETAHQTITTSEAPATVSVAPGPTHAVVASITDGDTIHVLVDGQNLTIRVIGIDTPETKKPGTPIQCYGPEATTRMTELTAGQVVILTADPTQDDTDKYGRELRYIDLPDGTDVGLQLIRGGYAREYLYRTEYQRHGAYLTAQAGAQADKTGLWGAC